jgi:hypothetical protein
MSENVHMQTATWLPSRELTTAAGPWNTSLLSDDDGEYFCRVLLASECVRFVPETGVLYRMSPTSRLSHIGGSDRKKSAMMNSMRFHIQYLRSLEESERVRKACLTYLSNWAEHFYPERSDMFAELQALATQLGGYLEPPVLRKKYAWLKPVFGWKSARWAQRVLPERKASTIRCWDKVMFEFEKHKASLNATSES